jgi:serine/threonine protein kinase/cbb3-type cytochrome oxidase subunit 3
VRPTSLPPGDTGPNGPPAAGGPPASGGSRAIGSAASSGAAAAGKRRIGPFQIEERLGVGGMGIVYRAIYTENGKEVALKVLSPGLSANPQVIARFEREMAILKRMRHPNIVQYFGGGRSGGQNFFAMEFVPGGSVEKLLKEKGRLPWEEAIEVLSQVAKALEYSHTKGVIHRDLKPANLFFSPDRRVRLGDFGIARDTDATALTAAGKTVGTYAYMAPEQISGKPPVSRRSDLYALGCVGFELLTGRPPFVAETPAEMLMGHLELKPPRVREYAIDCPIWLDEVIDRLLEKDPDDRYFDALAVQVALDEVRNKIDQQESFVQQTMVGATSVSATKDGQAIKTLLGGKPKKKKKKKQTPFYERAWFLAACLVVLIGGIAWALWPPGEAELYAAAAALMESEEPADHVEARDRYLTPLVERFPDGPHVAEAQAWLEQIEMDTLERQVEKRKEPRNEAERLFMDALAAEKEDRISAIGKYHSMMRVLATDQKAKLYVRLAQKRSQLLETQIGSGDQVRTVRQALRKADQLYASGRVGDARAVWNGVIASYVDVGELQPYVDYSLARLDGYHDVEKPYLGEDEPVEEEPVE